MNKLVVFLWACFCLVTSACSDNDDEMAVEDLKITADKATLLADGKEVVTFTVNDSEGRDVTSGCVILNGNEELEGNTFSTTVAKEYEFSAKGLAGGVSDKIKVLAVMADVKLKIEADKTDFVADGGDIAALKLTDEDGNDLTAEAVFYMDGGLLKRNAARSDKSGVHTITAMWKGKACDKTLKLNGVAAPADFTGRLLVEFSTSTSCMYCPAYIKAFRNCISDPRFVLVSVHREASSIYEDYYVKETKDRVQEFVDYNGGYVPYPGAMFNRQEDPVYVEDETQVNSAIPEKAEVGIAVEAHFDGLQFKVKVAAHARSGFTGNIGAVLVEDGIRAFQTKLGEVEMEKIMRDYQPSVAGEKVTFNAGVPVFKEYVFEKCGVLKTNKCEVVVFVTGADKRLKNVQRIAVGKVIGY